MVSLDCATFLESKSEPEINPRSLVTPSHSQALYSFTRSRWSESPSVSPQI